MKLLKSFISFLTMTIINANEFCKVKEKYSNQCVQFSVSSGTGCDWMCSYCANQLNSNNYYFTDNICTYKQNVGCVGNPIAGKTYTCCSN